MKRVIILFTTILLSGCLNGSPAINHNALLEQTRWTVVEISGSDLALTQGSYITFSDTNESRANGFAGCNRFGGSYTKKGEHLSFGPLMATRMYCPAMPEERSFFKALEQVERFSITEDTLTLRGKDGTLLKLKADTPTP